MGGKNPYIKDSEAKLPTAKYTLRFVNDQGAEVSRIAVDPSCLPYDHHGRVGSLLEIALGNGIEIDHACGGVTACSTCHVVVKRGLATCNEAQDEELDQLDNAPGVGLESRLACQCVPDGTTDVDVLIPNWNRNLVRE